MVFVTYLFATVCKNNQFKFTDFLVTRMKTQNNFIFSVISCLYHENTKMHQNVQQINGQASPTYSVSWQIHIVFTNRHLLT